MEVTPEATSSTEPRTAATEPPFGLEPSELEEWAEGIGSRSFRGRQLAAWLYGRRARTWGEMTDLPAALRSSLEATGPVHPVSERLERRDPDGTVRRLYELADGRTVEAVEIPGRGRRTVCLSTQVGCPVGCTFCASGLDGLERNLTAGETLAPFALAPEASHVVFMGMGEPLLNPATARAVGVLLDGFGLSRRRVTVSTSGVVPAMEKMAEWGRGVRLAVSLHAADDAKRDRLVPLNRKWRISPVLAAAAAYAEATGARLTYEYVLLAGDNDTREDARRLAALLDRWPARVNLLAWNPVPGLPFSRPATGDAHRFAAWLQRAGHRATVRRSRGLEVGAACGQLRREEGS